MKWRGTLMFWDFIGPLDVDEMLPRTNCEESRAPGFFSANRLCFAEPNTLALFPSLFPVIDHHPGILFAIGAVDRLFSSLPSGTRPSVFVFVLLEA